MPKWLRRYLYAGDLRAHFWRALTAGFLLRLCSAWFVYGPQALDDYKHGVYPAYQFFAGLPLDLPDYRSRLLIWMLGGFTYIASWFGVDSALGQVRAMYIGLALVSLLGIIGTHFYARTRNSRVLGALLLYMIALYPLMPFVSTRAFGEAVATSFVLFGFGVLESGRTLHRRDISYWTLGFVALGIAALFRFHAGILFVSYAAILLALRLWTGVLGAVIGGVFTLAAQCTVDLLSGKAPMGTLQAYLAANEGGAAQYGVSPWYNTWAFAFVVILAPFSLVLFRHARSLWRKQWPLLIPLLLFITAHSLVPHKEERFLYPVIGLELWALSRLWASAALDKWARRIFTPALFILGPVLLAVMCFVNTQEGEIEPPAFVQSRYKDVAYLDYESLFGASRFQFYFLRPPSDLKKVLPEEFSATRVDDELRARGERQAVVLLTSDPSARDQLRAMQGLKTVDATCLDLMESGSLVDRILYSLNPKHNQRRKPTWYLICERTSGV